MNRFQEWQNNENNIENMISKLIILIKEALEITGKTNGNLNYKGKRSTSRKELMNKKRSSFLNIKRDKTKNEEFN